MNQEWIDVMKRTERLKLSRSELLNYFGPTLAPFLITTITFIVIFLKDSYIKNPNGVLISLVSIGILTILVSYALFKMLNFSKIKIICEAQVFNQAIARTADELNLQMVSNKIEYARLVSGDNMFTAIRTQECVLINCTVDVDNPKPNYFNFPERLKIRNSFVKHLQEVKVGEPAPTYTQVEENQWSIKRTMMRIFVYLFFVTPILLIAYDTEFMFLIVISFLCLPYIYIDLKLVLRQGGKR